MFIAVLFTITKRWKNSYVHLDKPDTVWFITHTHTHTHTLEYYSASKRKEIPTQAEMQMNLEDIMLSKVSQS